MATTYSADDLENYLSWIGSKNLMNKDTLSSRRVASSKVLAVLDEAERQDLRQLDRNQVFARFQNASNNAYNPSSLNVYRSRFNSALDDFLTHHGDRSSYKASGPRAKSVETSGKPSKAVGKTDKRKTAKTNIPAAVVNSAQYSASTVGEGLTLPIPLRPGVVVKIFGLPQDLTIAEAKKVCAVVTAYAVIDAEASE
jgi:hypothetical protein